jgi:hypothetical protein
MMVNLYQTTLRHVLDNSIFHSHCCYEPQSSLLRLAYSKTASAGCATGTDCKSQSDDIHAILIKSSVASFIFSTIMTSFCLPVCYPKFKDQDI